MRTVVKIPIPECCVELYLTMQEVTKLRSLKYSMEANTRDNYSVEDANTAYCLIVHILNALEKNNENY